MDNITLDPADAALAKFELKNFFPYKVRLFYTHVSSSVAAVYQADHDISASEWRCIAILNAGAKMTAADIVLASSMTKVSVSRAIAKLRQKSWIVETKNRRDGRSKMIKLSASGKAVLQELLPKALDAERQLLDGISEEQLNVFYDTVAKIIENRSKLPHPREP